MQEIFSETEYESMLSKLFVRFPSFQKVGAGAYKPGTGNMEFFDQLAGHPHRQYKVIHVAGTNGKGSVSNMLASSLASQGLKVGVYTSPHILDFRERIRIVTCHPEQSEGSFSLISKEYIWDFVNQWQETFDHLDMSFFEITTSMALSWFAEVKTDVVVLETGLGGRLDSTNIVTPVMSIITNIGLDHCDMLGETLPEIAFEKAGIIKPKVPVVIGESHPETDSVFERKVLYTNLPEPEFMGSRTAIMSLLTFADKVEPSYWDIHEEVLAAMDLKGEYQRKNLRTVLAALDIIASRSLLRMTGSEVLEAIRHTAQRTGFRGRWEKISDDPYVICDIGHNEHGLRHNFSQLERMLAEGDCTDLIMVYGSVADKDVDAVLHLMPADATYVFTQAHGKRALAAEIVRERYLTFCAETGRKAEKVHCCGTVIEAMSHAFRLAASLKEADETARPLIYVGGSTYVVSEAVAAMNG
ncbi:MAG: bifunctional folylpolyglutamate synthase/dihydrofolate synthase [Bacteroidales bacterium]|nr:bifunctional folylpolyglutamate synthase/dihydrofolate synthase [Bacteroidales bacterium]